MEEDLLIARMRVALDDEASRHHPAPGAWTTIERRIRRQPWRRAVIAGAVVAAGATVIATVIIASPLVRARPPERVAAPERAAASLVLGRTIHMHRGVWDLAVGYGALWAVGLGVTYQIDPASGHILATVATPGTGADASVASGAGAIWVTEPGGRTHRSGVYRIDPHQVRQTKFVPLAGLLGSAIEVAYNLVWVTSDSNGGILLRIDPRTDHVSGAPIRIGPGSWSIVTADGGLWLSSSFAGGSTMWISATGSAARSPLNGVTSVSAAGAGALWSAASGAVLRVNAANGHVISAIRVQRLADVIFWHGRVWAITSPPSSSATTYQPVRGRYGMVFSIDPLTNRIVGRGIAYGITPAAITSSPTGLWISDFTHETLVHLVLIPRA
jgi:hypothetical protein